MTYKIDKTTNGFYVQVNEGTAEEGYLHIDGNVRTTTKYKDEWTGYFATEKNAREAVNKHRNGQ